MVIPEYQEIDVEIIKNNMRTVGMTREEYREVECERLDRAGVVDGQDKWGEEQEQGKMKERLFYHSLAEREAALDVLRKTGVSGGNPKRVLWKCCPNISTSASARFKNDC